MINLPLVQTASHGENLSTINARDLYNALEVPTKFTTWIERRIDSMGFIEDQDYFPKVGNGKTLGFSRFTEKKEYFLTLDMAKHIALMENNAKGREIRTGLIEAERQLREEVPALVRSLQKQNKQLMQAVAANNDDYQHLLRYFELGLTVAEMAKLVDKSDSATRTCLKQMTALGLINYQPNLLLSKAGKKGKGGIAALTADEKHTICQLHQQGYSNKQIREQVGRSRTAVQCVLKAYRESEQNVGGSI